MGCWDSWCPICGLCFHSPFIENISSSDSESQDNYSNEFKKIIKKTKWMEIATVLLPDKTIRHGFKETSCNIGFSNKIKKEGYILDTMANGIALHTDCWKLAKKQGIKLTYEDFDYKRAKTMGSKYKYWNQYIFTYIDYSPAKKYYGQDFDTEKLYKNPKDWYILYKPNNMNSHESKKNIVRICKNINRIKKNKPKIRQSPTVTATIFEKGTEKIGNDGNMYVVDKNKNGVLRWIKKTHTPAKIKTNSKQRPSPSDSANKFNLGTEKKGNDGQIYVVKKTSAGIKRWMLKNPKKRKRVSKMKY